MRAILALAASGVAFATPATAEAIFSGSGTFEVDAFSSAQVILGTFNLSAPQDYRLSLKFDQMSDGVDLTVSYRKYKTIFCDFGAGLQMCGGNEFPNDFIDSLPPGSAGGSIDFFTQAPFTQVFSSTYVEENVFDAPLAYFTFNSIVGTTVNYTYQLSAIPEPATWAMIIGGFGLAGTSLRRRRFVAVSA